MVPPDLEPVIVPRAPSAAGDPAWVHLAQKEGRLRGRASAVAVETPAHLAAAWGDYHLPESPPDVDFEKYAVLLLLQPDDACSDDLATLRVTRGELAVEWLSPPGGCTLPLIFRLHAVAVHRSHIPQRFDVRVPEPHARDARATSIRLRVEPGQHPDPVLPTPPAPMTKEELDAVFAGHEIRRCRPDDHVLNDGPAPVHASGDGTRMADLVRPWLRDNGFATDREAVPYIDTDGDGGLHVLVAPANVERLQAALDEKFGPGVVAAEAARYDFAAIDRAQQDLRALMGPPDGPGSIVGSDGIPGPVQILMVDPTRGALDAVAATVDPRLVCVTPELSGYTAGDPDREASG